MGCEDLCHNDKAGTGYIIFEGLGSFVGSKRVAFKINGYPMSKVKATGLDGLYFTGEEIKPLELTKEDGSAKVTLTYQANKKSPAVVLEEGDYTVSYEKNVIKGTAAMTVTGVAEKGFTGSKKITFKIEGSVLNNTAAGSLEEAVPFMKSGAKPAVSVTTKDGLVLVEGRDYSVTYKNNKAVAGKNAGKKAPVAVIKGKGNYIGTMELPFEITKNNVSENSVYINVSDKAYGAKTFNWKQNFKVQDIEGKSLNAKDANIKEAVYTIYELPENYVGNLTVGQKLDVKADKNTAVPKDTIIQVSVQMTGSYEGTLTASYRICDEVLDIKKAKISLNEKEYTGDEIEILFNSDFKVSELKTKTGTKALYIQSDDTKEANIEVVEGSYVKNIAKGTAIVTLRGTGDFCGTKTVSFKIGQRSVLKWLDEAFEYWK